MQFFTWQFYPHTTVHGELTVHTVLLVPDDGVWLLNSFFFYFLHPMYLNIPHVLEAGLVPGFRFASSKTTRTELSLCTLLSNSDSRKINENNILEWQRRKWVDFSLHMLDTQYIPEHYNHFFLLNSSTILTTGIANFVSCTRSLYRPRKKFWVIQTGFSVKSNYNPWTNSPTPRKASKSWIVYGIVKPGLH
jgi:hypothetical protein